MSLTVSNSSSWRRDSYTKTPLEELPIQAWVLAFDVSFCFVCRCRHAVGWLLDGLWSFGKDCSFLELSGLYLQQIISPFRMIPFHSLCVPGGLTDHKEEVNLQEIWYQDLTQLLSCTTGQNNQHKQPLTGLLWWWLLSSRALWAECSCIV